MSNRKYILGKDGEPKLCDDLMTWAAWFETGNRRVDITMLGDYCVSTVFLGLDYGFGFEDRPVVWETLVFKGTESLWFDRCGGSREQAEAMHEKMCEQIRNEEKRQVLNNSARLTHML